SPPERPSPGARRAGVDGRTVARVAAQPRTRAARRLHHRAPAAVLGGRARERGARLRAATPRPGAADLPRKADRDRRDRLAQSRRSLRRREGWPGAAGTVRPRVPGAGAGALARLLRDGGDRPALETCERGSRGRLLG